MRSMLATAVLCAAMPMTAAASPTIVDCDEAGHATVLQPAPQNVVDEVFAD